MAQPTKLVGYAFGIFSCVEHFNFLPLSGYMYLKYDKMYFGKIHHSWVGGVAILGE
jgi:hypothetical protein